VSKVEGRRNPIKYGRLNLPVLSGGMGRIYSGEPVRMNSLHRWSRYSLQAEAMDSAEHFIQEYEHIDCRAFKCHLKHMDTEVKLDSII
jgi:hypothetical protein